MVKIIPIILFLFTINILLSNTFIPDNNDELNYRQIEFSWPQIPNTDKYKLIIRELNVDNILYEINTINNIIVVDGYNLNWGLQYTWEICGYQNDIISECHDKKYFRLSNIHNFIPPIFKIKTLVENQVESGITMLGGYFQGVEQSFGFDNNGEILWFILNKKFRRLLENGNLFTIAIDGDPVHRELNLKGELFYSPPETDENGDAIFFHHDISKSTNDTYFTLSNVYEMHACPADCDPLLNILYPGGIIWESDIIREYDMNNNVIWDWNIFEHIGVQNYTISDFNIGPGEGLIDWTHSNEVFYDENENAVYLSIRNLSTITKINYDTKEVIWHLGDLDTLNSPTIDSYFNEHPTFSRQHTPILLENNNLRIFDNGTHNNPQVSRCLEYSITNNNSFELIWEYVLPDSLYHRTRGECVPLNNNNTLISTSQNGNILEVNNQDELVWHVVLNSTIGVNMVSRIQKTPNLFPSSFNILFDNYKGLINGPIIEIKNDNILSFDIINNGWLDDEYEIEIMNYNKIINVSKHSSKKIEVDLDEIFNASTLYENSNFTEYLDIKIYSKNKNETTKFNDVIITKMTIPSSFKITNAYPNPFNPIINLDVDIPINSNIKLNIYDLNGRLVDKIFNNYVLFGEHTFSWDATRFSSGVYILSLQSDSFFKTKKITLIK